MKGCYYQSISLVKLVYGWLICFVVMMEIRGDMNLEVKDGLLAIECSYPSNDDLCDLSRVWLTGNEVPWDPTSLDEENDIRILLCWDGESEFEGANNNDAGTR
eukprot:2331419-Ditylum_brightwellii.AAC.1